MTHTVTHATRADHWRRWECTCGWATDWTFYTRPDDAAAAIRHQIEHHRQEAPR